MGEGHLGSRSTRARPWLGDPNGNRVELVEMAEGSLQAKAVERLRQR